MPLYGICKPLQLKTKSALGGLAAMNYYVALMT